MLVVQPNTWIRYRRFVGHEEKVVGRLPGLVLDGIPERVGVLRVLLHHLVAGSFDEEDAK